MAYCIGIDIGGMSVKGGVVDKNGAIAFKDVIRTDVEKGGDALVERTGELILRLLDKAKLAKADVSGVGIGSPGTVDSAAGVVTYANNLRWRGQQVCPPLSKATGLKCFISNDANCAALGEATFGAAKNYADSVTVTLGTGVGGGIIINKKLFEGYKSAGAEIGHAVIQMDGEACTCGRRGCMEAYCSATALIRDTKRAMAKDKYSAMWKYCGGDIEKADGKTAFECARKGDASAKAVTDGYVRYLSEGLINIINILRPQAIILGGGVSAQGDRLIDPLKELIYKNMYGGLNSPAVEILQAKLGNDAGIIGAACLAM